jgi:hypothetical protein
MAHPHHENNDSYRLHRPKPDGLVAVFNQDGFLMAEHNPITGATSWHRVVPATKRESVERKLLEQFSAVADTNGGARKNPRTHRNR